jgi:hypothetical protein
MRARTGLSIFCLVLIGCGARSEIGGALPDASVVMDAADGGGNDVATTSCTTGVVQIATTASQPDTLMLDSEWVYWHDGAGIFRVKKTGGGVETLAKLAPYFWPDLTAFALSGGHLFYGAGDEILWDGQTITKLDTPGFAVETDHVFAWSRATLPSPIFRFYLDGTGGPIALKLTHRAVEMAFTSSVGFCFAEDPGVECSGTLLSGLTATDIVATDEDVWFTSNDATNGARVMHTVLSSLKTSPIADTTGAFALAQDDANLYFTDDTNLRVRRIEGKTGPVTDIASNPVFGPVDIVVDDTCVYWTAASHFDKTGSGAVMAGPKK